MSAAPFMQLYVADYIGDTLHLTTEQHGAYLLLLMAMWRAGGKLPNEEHKLARIVGLSPARWRRVSSEVLAFFDAGDGQITQKRLAVEIEKAREKSAKRADAGAKGGAAKSLKDKETALANATLLPWHSSEPEPELEKKKEEEKKPDGFSDGQSPSIASRFENRDSLIAQARTDLLAMGVAKSDVKPLVGKWLATANDDATAVLDAITRARDQCPHDPIAWITARLTKDRNNDRNSYADRNNVVAALRRIGERL